MADISGSKQKTKVKSQKEKASQRKKSQSKQQEHVSTSSPVVCLSCENVFTSEHDKLMECERCDSWYCIDCLKMSETVYGVMVERLDSHWYCPECEKPAITAVRTDKEIEERCAAYMTSLNDRLDKMQYSLDKKADADRVNKIEERVASLENGKTEVMQPQPTVSSISETIAEQKERDSRAGNIILYNIPESGKAEAQERTRDDTEVITRVMEAMGIENTDIIDKCTRIGKKLPGKQRLTKVTLRDKSLRGNILRSSKSLKDSDEFKNVYIDPDQTRLQRMEQRDLRKELKERREKGEQDIFIRGDKIVQFKGRAPRSKGGTAFEF